MLSPLLIRRFAFRRKRQQQIESCWSMYSNRTILLSCHIFIGESLEWETRRIVVAIEKNLHDVSYLICNVLIEAQINLKWSNCKYHFVSCVNGNGNGGIGSYCWRMFYVWDGRQKPEHDVGKHHLPAIVSQSSAVCIWSLFSFNF